MQNAIEERANLCFSQLRNLDAEGKIVSGEMILPGVWINTDNANGLMSGTYSTATDALIKMAINVRRPGRWVPALSIALAADALTADQVLGVVVNFETKTAVNYSCELRTGRSVGKFVSRDFPESRLVQPGRTTCVSLLAARDAAELLQPAAWRRLRLSFGMDSFDVAIHDARLFVASLDLALPEPAVV